MDVPAKGSFKNTEELIAAEQPDYPSFLFSEQELRRCAQTFKDGIEGIVTYAVKANPSPHVISILGDEGLPALDVASPNEIELARKYAPKADLHYNNPIRSRREIAAAFEKHGVKSFSIDNLAQLEQIAAIIPPSSDVEITIRFKAIKSRKAYDFGSKFGASEQGAIDIASMAKAMGYATSLCFHVGSQCEEVYTFERHIKSAARIAKKAGIELKRLNVGGGFPAPYPSSVAPPLDYYFDTIRRSVNEHFKGSKPTLIVEPGRAMVTSSTSLLLRVKHQRNDVRVYLNDGAYGSLMEVKFMPILPATRVWREGVLIEEPTKPCKLFGPTCDSYDVLPQFFELPESLQEDDWIEFALMGAYTQASVTDFNGFSRRDQYFVDEVYTG